MATDEADRNSEDDLIITMVLAAMSLPEAEREPFLREACPGDGALFAEVLRRITWEQRLNGFMLTPVTPPERLDRPFAVGEKVMRRFQIMRVAGEGGMGVVYEALDEKLGHRIALKCPRFEFRRRLSPEALSSLRVTHPNVCRVFEIHTAETNTGDVDFLTMEFLEGETLASYLPGAPARWLETAEGMQLARQLCAGLQAIHAQGVVHCDLKSGNVMLSTDTAGLPRAVIMDFGIAQSRDIFSSQTRGTPAYIAPELWKGQQASRQSDIYALGVLLYEMALGYQPFSYKVSWKERLESLPDVHDLREPIRSTILRCLDPDPARRFQSVAEVGAELGRGRSRRWILGGAGVVLAGLATPFAKEKWWPTSAVRLGVLPPLIERAGGHEPLILGLVNDMSYRLRMLGPVRRPFCVISFGPESSDRAKSADESKSGFGATHVISSAFRNNRGRWSISIELLDAADNRSLAQINRFSTQMYLDGLLFSLQSDVMNIATSKLALGVEPQIQTLNRESYADYLRGLYFARVNPKEAAQGIPYFLRVIEVSPGSSFGYAGLAEALLGAGDTSRGWSVKVVNALASAAKRQPDLAWVHLTSGGLSVGAKRYQQALEDFQRAADLAPNDSQSFISMGYTLYLMNRPQESQVAFRRALAAQPGYYKPYLDIGRIYFRLQNFSLAEQYLQEAARLGPGQTQALLDLAALCRNTGRLAKAGAYAAKSLKIRRTSSALEILGELQDLAGRYEQAISFYDEAVRVGPPSYKIWAGVGCTYRRMNRGPDAVRAFQRGLTEAEYGLPANPGDVERVAWIAFYYASLGDLGEARAMAARADTMAPLITHNKSTRKRLALVYDILHDMGSALRLLNDAPHDLMMELEHSSDLSPELRRDPRFVRLIRRESSPK